MLIQLTTGERRELERLIRRRKTEIREYRRAQMVLRASEGESVRLIARRPGTDRGLIRKWLKRFQRKRLKGLEDEPRSGRPKKLQGLERTQVLAAGLVSHRESLVCSECCGARTV